MPIARVVVVVDAAGLGGVFEQPRLAIDELLHLAAALQALERDVRRAGSAPAARKSAALGSCSDEQRVVRLAEEAGVLAGRDRAVADHVRIGDERRHARRCVGASVIDDEP